MKSYLVRCARVFCVCALYLVLAVVPLLAGIFGTVRGIVHDAQHRPISAAHVLLQAKQADWKREAVTDDEGKFQIDAVPVGDYTIQITHDGFRESASDLTVVADAAPL